MSAQDTGGSLSCIITGGAGTAEGVGSKVILSHDGSPEKALLVQGKGGLKR